MTYKYVGKYLITDLKRNVQLHMQVGHCQYCITWKKLLAIIVTFIKHFKHYLNGQKFLVRTDQSFLKSLMNFINPDGQIARLIYVLYFYDMKVEHTPGWLHTNAKIL